MPYGWTRNPENKRIYNLWFRIHRRCYDDSQLERKKGSSYNGCVVCERWHYLSNFSNDIKNVPGYEQWLVDRKMSLDKDLLSNGKKEYAPKNCCFVPISVNIAEKNKRNPTIQCANEANKVRYCLSKGNENRIFDSEKEACDFLGVRQCSVSSCFLKGYKCKGYTIARMDGGENYD